MKLKDIYQLGLNSKKMSIIFNIYIEKMDILISIHLEINNIHVYKKIKGGIEPKKGRCVMGFFDTLGKKASEAYNVTTKKTGEIAKEAKLKMKINENKSNINDLYKEIGKKVYEKHVREENIDIKADLEEECAKIDLLSSEIESCLTSILELKDKKQCIKCHAEIEESAVFCPKCGEKQPEIEVKEAEVVTENLENSEVKPENETEAEIVEEKVSGEDNTEKEKANEENKDISTEENNSNQQ